MKKIILIIAILAVNTLFAQTYFGPRLGVNIATMSGQISENSTADRKNITGLVIGGVIDHHFSDMLSLQAEILFAQNGMKEEDKYNESGSGYSLSSENENIMIFNTLEIPLLLKATFGNDFKFYGDLGPYFNYKMGGKYESEYEYTTSGWGETNTEKGNDNGKIIFKEEPSDYDGDDLYLDPKYYNRIDFGLYFGGGIAKQLGPGILTLDLRFGLGFNDFFKDEFFNHIYDYSKSISSEGSKPDGYKAYKNRNLSITVAYMFGGN